MSQSASDYLEQSLLNHIFRTDTFAKPSAIALALTSNIPTDSSLSELSNAGAYARKTLTQADANWSYQQIGGSGVVYNNDLLEFTQASADWGYVSGAAVVDSATYGAGNILYRGTIGTPRVIQEGDTLRIPVSGLSVLVS